MKNNSKAKKGLVVLLSFLLFLVFGVVSWAMDGSQVYLAGPTTAFAPLSDFSVSVLLDATQPINALDLEIIYPKDKLKFLSSNNTGSIVDIWQTPPVLLSNGHIRLVGGIFKSFLRENGLITKLSFKALNTGQPQLSFAQSNVYVADGKGTKLSLNAPAATFFIAENAPLLSLSGILGKADNSPPKIVVEQTKSLVDNALLIVFQAVDPDSGIKKIQMRVKKWLLFSPWQDVQNPVLYPPGAWNIEFRALSYAGLESIKSLSFPAELFKKILISFFLISVLVFIVIRVYNPVVEFCKNFTTGYNNRKRKL